MNSPFDDLQAAADRGELQVKGNEALRKSIMATEKRWIVMQVKEIAVHQQLTPEQFKDLCEYIWQFTSAAAVEGVAAKLPPAAAG